jgi:hypothetical protein
MPRKPKTPPADLPAFSSAFLYRWLWSSLNIHLTSPEIAASVRTKRNHQGFSRIVSSSTAPEHNRVGSQTLDSRFEYGHATPPSACAFSS